MSERLTQDISRYQHYCQFELKNCKYKDLFDLEHYCNIEECVDCDLTLGIDKLGEYENIDTDPTHLAKINKAFGLLKNIFELTSIPILLQALYEQQKITAEDRLLLEEMLIRG